MAQAFDLVMLFKPRIAPILHAARRSATTRCSAAAVSGTTLTAFVCHNRYVVLVSVDLSAGSARSGAWWHRPLTRCQAGTLLPKEQCSCCCPTQRRKAGLAELTEDTP